MIIDKCENCKWSRGFNSSTREDAILICVHPNIKYTNDFDHYCVFQRTQSRFYGFFTGACGKHARFFKQRGGNDV